MNRILSLTMLLFMVACSSGKIVPTTDICSIEKHWKDNIFQIHVNDEPINKHWYTHDEALSLTKQLAKDNKCMK